MAEDGPQKVKFEYIKSNSFRVIHADGAYGGLTPRLGIFLSFYSERPPIPKVIVHEVGPDGTLGDELKLERQTREGIIREAEIGITLDVEVARTLVAWLQEKINNVEEIRATLKKQKQEQPASPENIH